MTPPRWYIAAREFGHSEKDRLTEIGPALFFARLLRKPLFRLVRDNTGGRGVARACVIWLSLATLLSNGVVRASARVSLMRTKVVRPLCESIQEAARTAHAQGLVMDLNILGKATPAAGLYALNQLKSMVVQRIALVGGNPFMRTFARVVLTLGRFGHFAFFRLSLFLECFLEVYIPRDEQVTAPSIMLCPSVYYETLISCESCKERHLACKGGH